MKKNDDAELIEITEKEGNGIPAKVKSVGKGVTVLTVLIILIGAVIAAVGIKTIKGNYIGIKETWTDGVIETPLQPGTYVIFRVFERIYEYDMSTQVFVMNDEPNSSYGEGRRFDTYNIQSAEGQDMKIAISVQWRLDPTRIINIHKTIRDDFEEKIVRPCVMRVVKDNATTMSALDAYSGEGLVKLQSNIFSALKGESAEIRQRGIIVENFVVENIKLDANYVEQIKAKQVAVQERLRAIEETKANEAKAERARSEAQASYEKAVVEAKRDKETGIIKAELLAQQQVIAAEAEKKKQVLAAEGEKESSVLRAQAIEAIGAAEAEAKKLSLSAYAVEGADSFVKIEVSKNLAEGFKNIKGYLPEGMNVYTLSDSFMNAVSNIVGPRE